MRDTKIFFATDIHGSDVCLRKFLNAGRFYGVDAVVMGGDITGKMIVPVVEESPDQYAAHIFGRKRVVDSTGLPGLNKFIADAGFYPHPMTPDEVAELRNDPAAVDQLFCKLMTETMNRWVDMAEDRLGTTGIQVIFAPGNDDPMFVDDLLSGSDVVVNPDSRVVELPGGFPMISVGYSNRTPWDSPRELDEDDLRKVIDEEVAKLADPRRAIFNLHVPPKDTPIDQAMELDAEFRPVVKGGAPVITGDPPFTTGRNSASSSIAWSIGVSFGGTCRLKIARRGSASLATSWSMTLRRSSSSSSRGESHGVRLE
jgi:Icc-related predicted phosphoesterase